MTDPLEIARDLAASGRSGALVTLLHGDSGGKRFVIDAAGEVLFGEESLTAGLVDQVRRRIETETPGVVAADGIEAFVDVIVPMPSLRIFGAGPIAEALCTLAARAGFEVTVGDPRPAHAQPNRFPDAVSVTCGWPDDLLHVMPLDRRSFVISLLHAERFEDVLLPLALHSEARYIGALGSRKTHAARSQRLQTAGFDEAAVERIHGPVGLSIGAVTPEEIAISILAEIVQVRHQASGTRHQS